MAYCPPEHTGDFWIPLRGSASWFPTRSLGLDARGGVNLVVLTDFPGEMVAPELNVGVALGSRRKGGVAGVRLEAGWRRELGADTWTGLVGIAL